MCGMPRRHLDAPELTRLASELLCEMSLGNPMCGLTLSVVGPCEGPR
jgi:hypothetical protein